VIDYGYLNEIKVFYFIFLRSLQVIYFYIVSQQTEFGLKNWT